MGIFLTTSAIKRIAVAPITRCTSSNAVAKSTLNDAVPRSKKDSNCMNPNIFRWTHRLVVIPVTASNNNAMLAPKSAEAVHVIRYIAAATETNEYLVSFAPLGLKESSPGSADETMFSSI